MALEIERKFLVISNAWENFISNSLNLRQAYLSNNERSSVRIRLSNNKANINIKSMELGLSRLEYEFSIPYDEAEEILDSLCNKPQIEKIRHHIVYAGKLWEVDVFSADNAGLVVAEVELDNIDEEVQIPSWAGKEVTQLARYYNSNLIKYPYSEWSDEEKRAEDV